MPRHLTTVICGSGVMAAAVLLTACGGSSPTEPTPSTAAHTSVAVDGDARAGASAQTDTPGTASSADNCAPLPAPFSEVDACNAIDVATAALTTMYTTNPATDRTSQDAILRAVPLLSPNLVSQIAAPAPGDAAQGNVEWNRLKARHQKVIATVTVHRQDQSAYYVIERKAIPANATNTAAGQPLSAITASPAIINTDGTGFRLDSINPTS